MWSVNATFNVKYWRGLEIWVRSSKMARIDRSNTTSYWSAIVSIALSCTIFELFHVHNIVTLKSRSGVIGNATIR